MDSTWENGMAEAVTREAVTAYFPNERVNTRLHPVPAYNSIYVKNAKAACSTILLWLHRVHTGDHSFTPPRQGIHKTHSLPTIGQVGWNRVLHMLSGSAVRFTFVRDPISRVESAYRDKFVHTRSYAGRAGIQQAIGLPEDPRGPVTFEQFVAALEVLERENPTHMNPHWRPQHLNVMHPLVEYDFIGRLENFHADMSRLRELTGMPDVPVENRNVTPKESTSLFDGRPDLVRSVRQIYATDFELYGY